MDKISGASGIARSLTTRMNRKQSVGQGSGHNGNSTATSLGRAFSLKRPEKPTPRPEISLPIELVSATNPLAFSAPDLHQNASNVLPFPKLLTAVSSTTSLRSEGSTPALSSASSTTLTFSSIATPTEELPEHQLTSLREAAGESSASPEGQKSSAVDDKCSPSTGETASSPPAPAVPSRAPSHTKKTHQVLARQRSLSRMRSDTSIGSSSPPPLVSDSLSRKSTTSSRHHSSHSSKEPVVARSSVDMFSPGSHSDTSVVDANHPFGAELAKLSEVAEEFSPRRERAATRSRSRARTPPTPAMPPTHMAHIAVPSVRKHKASFEPTVWDEESEYLSSHGLRNFSAEEYMAEIGSPYAGTFPGSAL